MPLRLRLSGSQIAGSWGRVKRIIISTANAAKILEGFLVEGVEEFGRDNDLSLVDAERAACGLGVRDRPYFGDGVIVTAKHDDVPMFDSAKIMGEVGFRFLDVYPDHVNSLALWTSSVEGYRSKH
jgi:hypothetical protein